MNPEEIKKKLLKFIKKEKYYDEFSDYIIDIDCLIGKIEELFKDINQKRRIDCLTCKHFDRWSDSCPFCQYEYDKDTDCEQRIDAGRIEK